MTDYGQRRRSRWGGLFLVSLLIAAPPTALAEGPMGPEILVRFTRSVDHPEDPQFIDELSEFVGVPLSYRRAQSRGVHVLRIDHLANPAHLDRVIKLLSRNKEVITVKRSQMFYRSPQRSAGGML